MNKKYAYKFISAEKAKDGTTRFVLHDWPVADVRYISMRSESGELVYVPADCETLYSTYVKCKYGQHHFYDGAMKNKLNSLEMEKRFTIPNAKREAAARRYEQASRAMAEADRQEQRLSELDEEIEQLKADMERIDRDGYAKLFGEW